MQKRRGSKQRGLPQMGIPNCSLHWESHDIWWSFKKLGFSGTRFLVKWICYQCLSRQWAYIMLLSMESMYVWLKNTKKIHWRINIYLVYIVVSSKVAIFGYTPFSDKTILTNTCHQSATDRHVRCPQWGRANVAKISISQLAWSQLPKSTTSYASHDIRVNSTIRDSTLCWEDVVFALRFFRGVRFLA